MSGPWPYTLRNDDGPFLGLIALQPDQTIEGDFRRLLPLQSGLYVSRVPSGADVSSESLAAMEAHLADAAALLPPQVSYSVVGYGCTSGTAQIGAEAVAARIRAGTRAKAVTEPLSALIAACRELGVTRLGFLSPYVAEVSDHLRARLRDSGIGTPVFGSFEEAEEARVVRIDGASIRKAARGLLQSGPPVDALFLSCTNLRTLDVIAPLEADLGLPVLSSNLVLGWHMARLAGLPVAPPAQSGLPPARLFHKLAPV